MKRGVSKIHIQFGNLNTDSDGEGGVVIDTVSGHYAVNAIVLTPSGNVDASAFEMSANTYHVTVSTPDVVTVNYLTVSSD